MVLSCLCLSCLFTTQEAAQDIDVKRQDDNIPENNHGICFALFSLVYSCGLVKEHISVISEILSFLNIHFFSSRCYHLCTPIWLFSTKAMTFSASLGPI